MATGKALNGKPYAGNPHVRFDEGEVASAATPRRGSLLYNKVEKCMTVLCLVGTVALTAAGAVYDETTGYVRLLWNGTASVMPLTTNHVYGVSGTTTNYVWSDHLALHAGMNYYANTWFRGWLQASSNPATVYPIPCNRFVLDNTDISWKCGYPSIMVFENEGLFALGKSTIKINQDSCVLGGIGGTITIQETSASTPFTWQTSSVGFATKGHGFYVLAKIVGDADQVMRITVPSDQYGRVFFMGDMSDYLGTVNTISNALYVGTSLATKAVNATSCGAVLTSGADGAEIFISKVSLDASSAIGCAATNTLVVDTLTMAAGASVRFGWNGETAGCVEVTNSFAAAGTIGVSPADHFDPSALTNGPSRAAVLKVRGEGAFSLEQIVRMPTEARFVANEETVVPDDFPGMTFEVANEDGWTVLYVTLNQVVMQVVDNSGAANAGKFHDAETWSNGKTPAENVGADFYTDVGCYLPLPRGVAWPSVYHFPGRSFTVRKMLTFSAGKACYHFDELTLYTGKSNVQTVRAWVNGPQIFSGNLRLVGTNNYTFTFGNNTTQRWDSTISGRCNVILGIRRPDAGSNELCSEFGLTGTNTNFTGKWTVQHNLASIANPTQFMIFAVCESCNLGRPFPTFQYDALTVKNWQALKPGREESVLDDMSRGIDFAGATTQVVTPEGRTLALKCPITLSGVLRKSGPGTLALGGAVKPKFCGAAQSDTPLAGTNGLLVAEGWITPLSTNGVDGLAVEFAGGGIRLEHQPSDAGVAAYGLWNTKWPVPFARAEGMTGKVPVTVEMGDLTDMPASVTRYAICTVAADKADGVKGMFAVQTPFKGYVASVETRANADGTTTLLAVVKYGGLTITIR